MFVRIRHLMFRRLIAGVLTLAFVVPSNISLAAMSVLPDPGARVALSGPFIPSLLGAVSVDPDDPLKFRFYVDQGDDGLSGKEEYLPMIKDFLTALTIPDDRLWVNLSPYEEDRIIDDAFGLTDMGRDLLAQDYLLKQITASLLYPEEGTGKEFWAEIYRRAAESFGTIDIPVDTFNKVWIMPDTAEVYQQGSSAVVLESRLKVMLEADYLAARDSISAPANDMTKAVMRQVVIPVLEKEVNEGAHFARLRQIYHALILAAWYKKTMRESFLGKAYVDQAKVGGIRQDDVADNRRIYDRYVEAFRKGVFNYIKDDIDRNSGEAIARKYFSGGFTTGKDFAEKLAIRTDRGSYDAAEKKKHGKKKVIETVIQDKKEKADKVDEELSSKIVSQNNIPAPDEHYGTINSLVAQIKALQGDNPYQQPIGPKGKQLQLLKKKLIVVVKEMFRRVIAGEEHAADLIKYFDMMIDDENDSTFKAMALSGGDNMDSVFKFMKNFGMFCCSNAKDIPYEKIFRNMGLQGDLLSSFVKLGPLLHGVDAHEDFRKTVKTAVELIQDSEMKQEKLKRKNIYSMSSVYGYADFDDSYLVVNERRKEGSGFLLPGQTAQERKKWIKEVREKYAGLLPLAYNTLQQIITSMPGDKHFIFIRVKSEQSIEDKLNNKKDPKTPEEIFDFLAARIIFLGGLSDLIAGLDFMLQYSERLSAHQDRLQEAAHSIQKKIDLLQAQRGKEKAVKELQNKLARILDERKKYETKGFIIARLINYYRSMRPYDAVHALIPVGQNGEVMELQYKTKERAIVDDFERKFIYEHEHGKTSKKDGQDRSDKNFIKMQQYLMMYISWLGAAEMANYMQSNKEQKQWLWYVLDGFLEKIDKAQATEQKSYGGIDIRDVEGRLNVQGTAALSTVPATGELPSFSQGFFPVILSIETVDGLPFLTAPASTP